MAHTHPQTTPPGPTGLERARAAAGPPPAGVAGKVPAELVLQTGPGKPSGLVDRSIHLSVLKELLGPQIRDIIRAELARAIELSPDGLANLSRRPSLPRSYGAKGTPTAAADSACPLGRPGTGKDDDRWPCNTQCYSSQFEQVEDMGDTETEDEMDTEIEESVQLSERAEPGDRQAPPTIAKASADGGDSVAMPLLPTGGRLNQNSGELLYSIVSSETMDITKRAAESKRDSHWIAERFPSLAAGILRLDTHIVQIGSESMESPEPSNKISQIADSCWFQTTGNILTLVNCAFLTFMADWNFENYDKSVPVPDWMVHADNAFLVFFTLELAGRLARHRLFYFVNSNFFLNWVDFIIVLSGWFELAAAGMMGSMSFLRQLRSLRLLKVLRLLRFLKMFRTLQAVFDSLANTLTELIWCAITLLLIEYMFALMIVMRAGTFLRDESHNLTKDGDEFKKLSEMFGCISSAVMSLFMVSMGAGDWSKDYEVLAPTGRATQAIYLVFVVFSFIAVLNVILGVFVEKAMKNLAPTREEQAQQHAAEEMEMINDVKALCLEGDQDANGKLCLEEWQDIFSQGKMAAYMDAKGFRSHDLHAYFEFCSANSNGEIDIEAFVRGCCRLRGPASCFDVKTMLVELARVHQCIEEHLVRPRSRPVAGG